jgi:hypothetical protein
MMAAQFDGDNLLITLDAPSAGVLNQTAEQVYDDAKQWYLGHPDNRRYPFPFTTAGGDDVTATQQAGAYYFVRNDKGWRIWTTDEDQDVFWDGNLIPFDLTQRIIATRPGRTVAHFGLQPITTQIISGSGVTQQDKDDIENQIFARAVESGYSFEQLMRIMAAVAAGNIIQTVDGDYTIRDINNSKDRIDGTPAANSGRTITTVDGT